MAQQKSDENLSFDQVLKLVDALGPEERGRLYTHLQFRFWDEDWKKVRQQLDQQRAVQGLPPATDEDVHDAVDAMRTPEDWADLRHEIQKGIDQLDQGEGIPAEQVFAELRERYKARGKKGKS
ncbi:MAG: hypothetical protein SGJ27_28575 [Candidatus Melainabacteria bacterium]|nr:hypothetical protein [Candidatus Melainabacteria bacterium]